MSMTGSMAYNLGYQNPLRYRGYVYDPETNLYYLQSRYYDPQMCRFINADSYASTGQGTLGNNMFTYCNNNPVNAIDPIGEFGITATILGVSVWKLTLSIIGIIGLALLTQAVVQNPPVLPSISLPKFKTSINEDSKATDIATTKSSNSPDEDIYIYRWGRTNPGNLTPKEKDLSDGRGLSFSTVPSAGCVVTTIKALNATGTVYAVKDGPTHVSVHPIGGTMSDWVTAGSNSVWTQAVKSVVVKWDGGK